MQPAPPLRCWPRTSSRIFRPWKQLLRTATPVVLVNNPHNSTGAVFREPVLQRIVDLAVKHDAVIVADEVYEHLTFGPRHIPLATLPGEVDRTLTISSAGKTFALTGLKIGWLSASAELIAAVRTVKSFLTYSSGSKFQAAIARGLRMDDAFFTDIAGTLRAKRNVLSAGLQKAGLEVYQPQGTYFVNADVAPLASEDATVLARRPPEPVGVAAIPAATFCHPEGAERTRRLGNTNTDIVCKYTQDPFIRCFPLRR